MAPRPRSAAAVVALSALAVLGGCGGTNRSGPPGPTGSNPATAVIASPTARRSTPPPDPARVGANELGQVPILMFHQVVAAPRSDFDISPTDFRSLLDNLAAQHYVPVTAADYATGRIDIPAGSSPVVLTFDDATRSQFALGPRGEVAPLCAVGILLEVAARHPGFTPVATFYLNEHPFGQSHPATYLTWLISHHFDLGNHTLTHANLRQLGAAGVQTELAGEQREITAAAPGYSVTTMALPFGATPIQGSLAHLGSSAAGSYDYRAVMLVGANPAPSPYAASADVQVPRIRAASLSVPFDAHFWLPRLARSRYVSDGDPAHISFPKAAGAKLAVAEVSRARPY